METSRFSSRLLSPALQTYTQDPGCGRNAFCSLVLLRVERDMPCKEAGRRRSPGRHKKRKTFECHWRVGNRALFGEGNRLDLKMRTGSPGCAVRVFYYSSSGPDMTWSKPLISPSSERSSACGSSAGGGRRFLQDWSKRWQSNQCCSP
jgi:hypothetical protein